MRSRARKDGIIKDTLPSVGKSTSESSVESGIADLSFSTEGSESTGTSQSTSTGKVHSKETLNKTQNENKLNVDVKRKSNSTSEIQPMRKSKSKGVSKRASTGMITSTIADTGSAGRTRSASRRIKQSTSTDTGIFTHSSTSGGISKSITAYDLRSLSTVDSVSVAGSFSTVDSLDTTEQNDILNIKGRTSATEKKSPMKTENKAAEVVETGRGVDYRYGGWMVILCCFFIPCVEF